MRYKNLKTAKRPIDLAHVMIEFGKLKNEHPEHATVARLGMRLIRELQHTHKVLEELRRCLPKNYNDYFDPLRLDKLLARTVQSKWD